MDSGAIPFAAAEDVRSRERFGGGVIIAVVASRLSRMRCSSCVTRSARAVAWRMKANKALGIRMTTRLLCVLALLTWTADAADIVGSTVPPYPDGLVEKQGACI